MTCTTCQKPIDPNYVSEDRQGRPYCYGCASESNRQAREERKRARAAAPRCEVPGCGRRGTWHVGPALMCGLCKNTALGAFAGSGLFGYSPDRTALLAAAERRLR